MVPRYFVVNLSQPQCYADFSQCNLAFLFFTVHHVACPDRLLKLSFSLLSTVSPEQNTFSLTDLHTSLILSRSLFSF